MLNHLPLTLGADLAQLLVWGVILMLAFGGSLINYIKKKAQENAARQRRVEDQLGPGRSTERPERSGSEASGAATRVEELAAQRRRELAEMARRRQAAQDRPAPTQIQPGNLTMEEARQRATAKAEYERRAEALRQQAAQARAQLEARMQAQAEELRRRADAARQQAQATVRAPAPARSPGPRGTTVPPMAPAPVRSAGPLAPSGRRRGAAPSMRQTMPAPPRPAPKEEVLPVAQAIEVAPAPATATDAHLIAATRATGTNAPPKITHGPLAGLRLTRRTMRQAIALREILDVPVGLRSTERIEP